MTVADLQEQLASYLALQDDALRAGDDESAEALGEAIEAVCADLDALNVTAWDVAGHRRYADAG